MSWSSPYRYPLSFWTPLSRNSKFFSGFPPHSVYRPTSKLTRHSERSLVSPTRKWDRQAICTRRISYCYEWLKSKEIIMIFNWKIVLSVSSLENCLRIRKDYHTNTQSDQYQPFSFTYKHRGSKSKQYSTNIICVRRNGKTAWSRGNCNELIFYK